MPLESAAGLMDALRLGKLLEPAQLNDLDGMGARFPEPRALAGELIRRGWLTPFQANLVLQGRAHELLLGSYVLLERLGEGGFGAVFKARNWKLAKVVALKLIRKERLDNPDAVRRFHREIRAAAQLDHPNIVRAIDADEVNGTHLLVMEYVQGMDLAKVVKKNGPLPADRACDCCRQAALGLQHACERGLVHRDIKPHNLLLTPNWVVKILDMGLARLNHADEEGEASSTMTREGTVMGTLDFIAPEQAMDSHTVDVRADLYSLGCTLYYLLTGRVPFPGGTAMEKLVKHQSKEPEPVERLRPGMPPQAAAVVRKLMAKRPDDRYPTPAAAAAALASAAAAPTAARAPSSAVVVRTEAGETTEAWASIVTSPVTDADAETRRERAARRALLWLLGGAAGLVVLALGLVGLIAFLRPTKAPPTPAPAAGKPADDDAVHDGDRRKPVDVPVNLQIQSVAAELRKRNPGFDGRLKPTIEDGVVTGLEFLADDVMDLRPVLELPGLKMLACRGSDAGKGRLADLSGLRNAHLTALDCDGTAVADLSPLKGMPLTSLSCGHTNISDLSPLRDSCLTELRIRGLKGADLSPLRGLPLTALQCDLHGEDDVELVRSIKTLETINETPAADFWARHETFTRTLVGKHGEYSSVAGLSGDAFRQWIEEVRVHGYRPLFVNGCDAGGSPRFACIARKDVDCPAWQLRFNLTWAEYQSAFEELAAQRYYPPSTTGYLSGPAVRFAGVWVQGPFPQRWDARHGLRPSDFRDKLKVLKSVGMRPVFASAYPDGAGSQLYVGLFSDAGPAPWEALYDLSAGQYEKAIDSWRAKGYHPIHLSACDAADGPHFGVIFLKDDSPCAARTGLSAEEYRDEMEKEIGEGLAPVSVAGYHEGGALRYAAVWLRKD